MYDFIYNLWFIYNECIWWEREKNPEIYKNTKSENIHLSAKMEADCFPVSENTENKPDLP